MKEEQIELLENKKKIKEQIDLLKSKIDELKHGKNNLMSVIKATSTIEDFGIEVVIEVDTLQEQIDKLETKIDELSKQIYNLVKQYKIENIDVLEVRELSDFIFENCSGFYFEEGITFYENLNVLARHENIGTDDIFEAAKLGGAELDAEWYSCDYFGNIESLTEREVKIKLIEFINKKRKKKE
jgi:chaperonin cofactor prefoldin